MGGAGEKDEEGGRYGAKMEMMLTHMLTDRVNILQHRHWKPGKETGQIGSGKPVYTIWWYFLFLKSMKVSNHHAKVTNTASK